MPAATTDTLSPPTLTRLSGCPLSGGGTGIEGPWKGLQALQGGKGQAFGQALGRYEAGGRCGWLFDRPWRRVGMGEGPDLGIARGGSVISDGATADGH